MDDRGINIDIVFRNGLKDLEVLPPPEIWDKVSPVLIKKQRPLLLIRVAALIAIVLSVSFLAYQWNREMSNGIGDVGIAYNEVSAYPESSSALDVPVALSGTENSPVKKDLLNEPIINATDNVVEVRLKENDFLRIIPVRETGNLSSNTATLSNAPQLMSLHSSDVDNSTEIYSFDESFSYEEDTEQITERWSIAALASPTYYSRFNSGQDGFVQQLKESEQPAVSYSGGVSFAYKINNKLSIQSGIFFSSVGQEVGGINSFGGFQKYDATKGDRNFEITTTSGTIFTNNADVFLTADGRAGRISTSYTRDVFDPLKANLEYINNNLLQNFSFVELPIMLRYKIVDRIIDFNFVGGISYNMLVSNSVYTMVDGSKYFIGKTEGLNMMMFSSSMGMAMEYSFSEKLSLNLEPTFRYYLNPFDQLSGSLTHPYSFGIFSGLSYKF